MLILASADPSKTVRENLFNTTLRKCDSSFLSLMNSLPFAIISLNHVENPIVMIYISVISICVHHIYANMVIAKLDIL